MASKCRKFVPNIFNKTKCQTCFAAKEAHSAEALENNKASRKVSRCGYLFVAPDFDFNSPVDRTKRWQRRFFVLYDDAELTYSVDDNRDTIPQCVIDMNKVLDVIHTEKQTSHPHSIGIVTPEKTHYIKGESKEESQWWFDILVEFPRSLKSIKPRRKTPTSNKENVQPSVESNSRFLIEKVKGKTDLPAFSTYRGVRSLKHKYDKNYQDGLRKSSSLQDISSENKDLGGDLSSLKYLSSSGDHLNSHYRRQQQFLADHKYTSNPYFTIPRTLWHHSGRSSSSSSSSVVSTSTPSNTHSTTVNRSTQDDNKRSKSVSSAERSRIHRERSSSLKDFGTTLSLPRDSLDSTRSGLSGLDNSRVDPPRDDDTESNETDELKMARSSELNSGSRTSINVPPLSDSNNTLYEDMVYMKKGWLIKLAKTEKEPKKHWFVLAGNSLHYYKDAKAEDSNNLDGRIDLTTCYEVSEISLPRNYGFRIKTRNGEYQLAAMTSGIRNNWMKALRLCMDLHNSSSKRKMASTLAGKTLLGLTKRASDDFEVTGAIGSTKAVKNTSGETAFQLVGHQRESNKNTRRHHSDVNPGNVSKILSVSEFSANLDSGNLNLSSSTVSNDSPTGNSSGRNSSASDTPEEDKPTSTRMSRHHGSTSSQDSLSWSQSSLSGRRYGDGKSHTGTSDHPRRSKHNMTTDTKKEDERRDKLRRGKSPSARIKEKSRSSKTPRLHSPPPEEEEYKFSLPASQGPLESDDDLIQELYHDAVDTTDGPTIRGVKSKDGLLVEILETEVQSLKDSLGQKEQELAKMLENNLELKNRLQSADSQGSLDRWGSNSKVDSSQVQTVKRQLKESKDAIQRQKNDIDNLKSKLEMSVSKLTGTEKALSEALRELKQEKEKFMRLTSEWNRRTRTLENQLKDSSSKLDRSKESLVTKERECRRLEAELKSALQKTREYEHEIVKLRAVEHEYQVLQEKFDNKEHDIVSLRNQLRDREAQCKKMESDIEELEKANSNEQDALENHIEQLQSKLCAAHQRQTTMTDSMTSNMAEILQDKERIISTLEERLMEKEQKLCEMAEELESTINDNRELSHNVEILQEEREEIVQRIERLQSVQARLSKLESENTSLKNIVEQLKKDGDKSVGLGQKEREEFQKTICDLNKQVQGLQLQIIEKFEDLDRSTGSSSHLDSQELLHTVLLVDSELKDVNCMLLDLRHKFDAYLNTLQEENLTKLISLADMVEDIGRKCQSVQDKLKDVPITPPLSPVASQASEYSHEITVNPKSSSQEIFSEYKGLKNKFDCAVKELKCLRKEMSNVYNNYDKLEKEDLKVKTELMGMEKTYKDQLENMMKRVEALTTKLDQVKNPGQVTPSKTKNPKTSDLDLIGMSSEVEKLLDELDNKFAEVESNIAKGTTSSTTTPSKKKSRLSVSPDEIIVQLKEMKAQLDHTNVKLKDISEDLTPKKGAKQENQSTEAQLKKRLSQYGEKIDNMTNNLEKVNSNSDVGTDSDHTSQNHELAFEDCLSEIRERIVEIGEQLDAIEEDSSESDESEEDEDETSIDDVREKLSNLLEFVEEHSNLSSFDWKVLDKMSKQHSAIMRSKSTRPDPVSQEDRLKLYVDRVSLEAVILGEMASLLQNKYTEPSSNPLTSEINNLNNLLLHLHQQLDAESHHLNFEERYDDVLSSYADVLAERIVLESDLCENQDLEGKSQITMLAMESLTRSQIDSQINETLRKPLDELENVSSHVVSRALIQGELTCALQKVKNHLKVTENKSQVKENQKNYAFHQLKTRETTVLEFCEQYENKVIEALALIISRQVDELNIDQGPMSVLEAICSEISTIMEKNIQSYKQKVRTASDTQTAHKYDMIVSQLRSNRESVLNDIKKQHGHYAQLLAEGQEIADPEVMFQSLDSTINNFGEILSKKAIIVALSAFLDEMYNSKDLSVYENDDGDHDSLASSVDIDRGVRFFLRNLSESLERESLNKQNIVLELQKSNQLTATSSPDSLIIEVPDLAHYPQHLSPYADNLIREAVFQTQLTYVTLKMRIEHEQEMVQHKKTHSKISREDTQDSEMDFPTAIAPLEEVFEANCDEETEILHMFGQQMESLRQNISLSENPQLEEELQQLEHVYEQALTSVQERHEIQLEIFKQELSKLEKVWKENDKYRDTVEDLEEELQYMKSEHEEEVDRMKQDVLTAVGAIRANEELSETNLTERVQNLIHQLTTQKRTYKLFLEGLKRKLGSLDKSEVIKKIDEQLMTLKRSASQDEDMYSLASSTSESDLSHTDAVDGGGEEIKNADAKPIKIRMSADKGRKPREAELEKLRKEKEEALAEEMRNTKAALDAMRKAYEVELSEEKEKYKEALINMYTSEFVAEIRHQHEVEIEKIREEQKQMEMHYSSKTEDYKILEVKMKQMKEDYDGHIRQLITSNEQLNRLVNEEVDEIKEFIKTKPSRLAPGSATVEEELYDAQIMVRVKDAELQKLRLQVKNHENSIHRMMEEQRQTMTENLRLIKENQELNSELKRREEETVRLGKSSEDSSGRRPVRRAPSFHQRARSPSPTSCSKKEGEHVSRDGHKRRHLGPKDLKRSKSSPSLPYVFDTKAQPESKSGRELKTPRSVKAAASKR